MNTGANRMRLDRSNARCLGVCAGIANWLDIPATLVRIVFVICVLAWPPLLVGYFILYFCLDKDITPDKMQDFFNNTPTAEHFRKLNYRKPIYKNESDKRIAGVCSGIADYLEVSAFSVRLVTLLSLFVFGPFTFWAYIICMFVFDPDPNTTHSDRYERKMARRQHRHERREARRARKAEKRRSKKARKSYINEEIDAGMDDLDAGMDDLKAELDEAMDEVHIELRAEVGEAVGRARKASSKYQGRQGKAEAGPSRDECTRIYSTLEKRLREIEAFMTSKKFRLHCEINRI